MTTVRAHAALAVKPPRLDCVTNSAEVDAPLAGTTPDPERWTYTRGDYEVSFYRWAKAGAPKFLLVHGIGMGHATFGRFIEAMAPHAEVIAVDLPGFGNSAEPAVALSIPDTAELLAEAVCDRDLGPVIGVGHSMGAQVIVELAAKHAELVTRVVLFAPSVNASERTLKQQARRMMQDLFRGKPAVALVVGVSEYLKAGPRWFLKKLGPTLEHRIEDRLPDVHQPAIVLVGSKDRVTPPEWCYQVALALPDGELAVLGGPGHEAMLAEGETAAERVLLWLEAPAK